MFHFRLQKMLELRRTQVDRQRRVVAAIDRERIAAQSRRSEIEREREEHNRRCEDTPGQSFSVLELRGRVATSAALAAQLSETEAELERIADRLRREKETLLGQHQGVRALERLREKKLESYRNEMEAQERKALDDIQGRSGGIRARRSATPSSRPR